MRARLIGVIGILEGLVLLGLSLPEIRRERNDWGELKAALQSTAKLSDQAAKIDVFPTSPDVFEAPNDGGWREVPWWIVGGVGAALFGAGVIDLFGSWKRASWFHGASPAAAGSRRFHFPSNGLKLGSPPRSRLALYLFLFGVCILTVFLRIDLERDSVAATRSSTRKIPDLIFKLPPLPARIIFHSYSRIANGVSSIKVPYNPAHGPWIVLEEAMVGFATSNGFPIVSFEAAGSKEAYVCVRHEDAAAMRRFVRSMGKDANKAAPASRSQPVWAQTNKTSAAAGSGR